MAMAPTPGPVPGPEGLQHLVISNCCGQLNEKEHAAGSLHSGFRASSGSEMLGMMGQEKPSPCHRVETAKGQILNLVCCQIVKSSNLQLVIAPL